MKDNNQSTILIVENDVMQTQLTRIYLEKGGYWVLQAKNPTEARDVLQSSTDVDLITTAIMMPDEDGFSLIESIRRMDKCKDIPILCISTILDDLVCARLRSIGCNDYLSKPYTAIELLGTVDRLLNK